MIHQETTRIDQWYPETTTGARKLYEPFKKEVSFINNTRQKLFVGLREGVKSEIDRNNSVMSVEEFIVRVEYTMDENVLNSMCHQMGSVNFEYAPAANCLYEQLAGYVRPSLGVICARFRVEYRITYDELLATGGVVYLADLDIVVGTIGKITHPHPYTREQNLRRTSQKLLDAAREEADSANFIFIAKLIDNANVMGKKWIRVGKDQICVEPIQDPSQSDGVYVVYTKPTRGSNEPPDLVSNRYAFGTEIPFFTLHNSREEAEASGLSDNALKATALIEESHRVKRENELSIQELEHKARNMDLKEKELTARERELNQKVEAAKLEAENLRRTYEDNNNRWENERLVRIHELNQLQQKTDQTIADAALLKEKHIHELSTLSRKNTADLLKIIPSVVLGVVGIMATWQKLKKPAE